MIQPMNYLTASGTIYGRVMAILGACAVFSRCGYCCAAGCGLVIASLQLAKLLEHSSVN